MTNVRRPTIIEFDSLNLPEIGRRFRNNDNECIRWCREFGLLAINMICPRCYIQCNEQNNHNVDGKIWRCMQKQSKKKISIRVGSFLEISQLKLWKIIGITYIWTRSAGKSGGFSVKDIQKDLEIGSNITVVDWNQFCRDIAVTYFLNNRVQLGGPGSIVEIDESLFSRRRYNRGRIKEDQWIFGAYDIATKEGLLIPVAHRDAATILTIIIEWIRPGTEIWSDMWAAYQGLAAQGFQHGTVNHTLHFVDPATNVASNRVEAMWQKSKTKFKAMFGPTNREMIPDYLSEFMWTQRFKEHSYFHFWNQVEVEYPV
ncbi:uncharacterized protein LOC136085338 [Hydra vulgaris]|uniref:Uncharacterized protein LOC136085338 n=1 Tax=Hydra vulgaris TaxID=6087 RepID=A0ABM4CLP5_HYDVU